MSYLRTVQNLIKMVKSKARNNEYVHDFEIYPECNVNNTLASTFNCVSLGDTPPCHLHVPVLHHHVIKLTDHSRL